MRVFSSQWPPAFIYGNKMTIIRIIFLIIIVNNIHYFDFFSSQWPPAFIYGSNGGTVGLRSQDAMTRYCSPSVVRKICGFRTSIFHNPSPNIITPSHCQISLYGFPQMGLFFLVRGTEQSVCLCVCLSFCLTFRFSFLMLRKYVCICKPSLSHDPSSSITPSLKISNFLVWLSPHCYL